MSQIEFVVRGRLHQLSGNQVVSILKAISPGPIRAHAVEVDGKLYPVKQAFAAVTGLDLLDFNTNQARRVFQAMGFKVTRVS